MVDLIPDIVDLSGATIDVGPGQRYRQIGTIDPAQVTVEEIHDDELVITMHPVEQGAIISDHAYKLPPELRVRCAWSNAWGQSPGYAKSVYDQLQALQILRQPFMVWTGKRFYIDMLVASLRVRTSAESEFSLLAEITLRQIIQVSTALSVVDASAMRDPRVTAPTTRTGEQQLRPDTISTPTLRLAAGLP